MMLYDTASEYVKSTVPNHYDNGFLPLLAVLLFLALVQINWIIQVERVYFHLVGSKNCWARRLRQRLENRQWNNAVLKYCKEHSITLINAGDVRFNGIVGEISTLNDLNGQADNVNPIV